MTTYRPAGPDDRAKVIDFINMVFSMTARPHNFKTLIPKVYADGRGRDDIHNIAVDEKGDVRGVVAILPQEMRVLDETLRTGFVGSVSVHPFSRGEGHMKALMRLAVEREKARGADLIALGGQRQRYEYFGFTPGGLGISYTITRANLRHTAGAVDVSDIAFVPFRGADAALIEAACRLHAAQAAYIVRPPEDFAVILETWQESAWIILKGGAFAGYLAASPGRDSLGELRLGEPSELRAVLKAWFEEANLQRLALTMPGFDRPMNRELSAIAEHYDLHTTQRLRVLNWPRVIRAFLRLNAAGGGVADGALSLWIDGEPLTISVRRGEVTVAQEAPQEAPRLSAMEAQTLFFSPLSALGRGVAPDGWLPLPFFIGAPDEF